LIDGVLAGDLSASEAVQAVEELANTHDADVDDAYHALIHFREDEDIRSEDSGYGHRQSQWLARHAQKLRRSS
jgi:hypothetical protein